MIADIKNFIYKNSPLPLQNLAITFYGYQWKKRRFGGIYRQEYEGYRQREVFTPPQWESYQNQHLNKLLLHAVSKVPYYKEAFNGIDINAVDIHSLHKLPLLEKNTLRKLGETTLLSTSKEPGGEFYSSSGSTGTPTKILFSAAMHQRWSAAFEARIRNWAGLSINNARGMIGGRRIVSDGESEGPFYRYNRIEKQVYFSAYHISEKNAANYVEAMHKYKTDYMTGYAMSNYFLARFIEKKNLHAPTLKAVITSSEKLTMEMRETFERVYGCKSFDSYSGVEACGLISECEKGKLHISPDVAIIEIIKADGSYAKPGEEGEAVCTGFLNYDQPLIRYKIGDVLRLSKQQTCECGRHMPVVDEIIGRTEDTVIGPDGREMVRFHGIFVGIPSIIEGQVIQHTLTDFEIRLVLHKSLEAREQELIDTRMRSQLGNIKVTTSIVNSIPRNQNGKFKAVISYVKRS
ncbi:MAG: hypothetical protein V4658_14045 [Bacteroidota bacterium]